ncbi:hypothetical protein V1512DRAFT_231632 [Lipomyces arxii]|uniref:uncharacterized protein n=1 Tax=Lipomyces arxii TaxID=56418 RepID=UPI0034CDDA60
MAPHVRPENVLKRAEELLAVEQAGDALNLLHEIITSKRTRNTPIASLEPIMLRFVELCVQLRRGKLAKEGLYTYKNVAQNTSVGSIEVVLKRFIDLSKEKVNEAQEQADKIALDTIDDLEASETPESIMLSTVSTEQSKDRTDRAVVTPWLKFLWEAYRTVLEILRNNARLEIMYQATAIQAFQFCLKYARKTEFRRLCELLRNHLQSASKNLSQVHAINLNDPDTLQRHLDTRFAQLNAAVELELWQEAFRSVEDIHTLLTISKRPPKPAMMVNYYEKLTKIFLVSDNYLFHAAAASRYHNLRLQTRPMTEAEASRSASIVLLSAIAIPVISTSRFRAGMYDVDESKHKNVRLSGLLGLSKAPSRASLLKEALSKGILSRVRPEINALYQILEVDFHPLSICRKISPIMSELVKDDELARYIQPLHQVILTRLFQQLSQVYDSLKLDFVVKLVDFPAPFSVSPTTIEKFIMNGCKKGELAIKINHADDSLTFESDVYATSKAASDSAVQLQPTPTEIVRTELSRLAKALFATVNLVDTDYISSVAAAKEAALQRAVSGVASEHKAALERKNVIEDRLKQAETILQKREEDESRKRALKLQQEQAAEQTRLAEEMRKRELDRIRREQDAIMELEKRKIADEMISKGIKIAPGTLETMDTAQLREVEIEQTEKRTKDISERMRLTAKRIDHLERAYRKAEIPLLEQDYEKQKLADKALHEERRAAQIETAKAQFEAKVLLKKRLRRMVPDYEEYKERLLHM